MIADGMAGLKAAILSRPAVTALVGDRVFINEVGPGALEGTRAHSILLRQSGGIGTTSTAAVQDLSVEIFCYGQDSYEAERVRRALFPELKRLIREVHAGVLIHRCNPTGGPVMAHEPEGALPSVSQTWDCLVSEVPVS